MLSHFSKILIVGVGASSLNIKALISGRSASYRRRFIFLDTLDPETVKQVIKLIDSKTAVVFISKSGNTHETNLLLEHISSINFDVSNSPKIFILSSKEKSKIHEIASKIPHEWIIYPESVSGRFALLEKPFLDIVGDSDRVVSAAKNVDIKISTKIAESWINHFHSGRSNWVIMNYIPQLDGLLLWIRQIVAESLGKNNFGILPVLATGPMDEHSQLQLFLDGPDDKFYHILSRNDTDTKLGDAQSKHAIMTETMLLEKGRDVVHESYRDIDDQIVGRYIGIYSEVVRIIAKKIGFDPYNQPSVEDIKKGIRGGLNSL